ncbi:MAG: thermonuclease family protein, partial [Desulfovibrio sp.]|nr:thermonuclease family protein [Desulfovibrio sp.]
MNGTFCFCSGILLAGLLLGTVQSVPAQPAGQHAEASKASGDASFLPPVLPGHAKGTVARAMDGDTLKLADGRMVRLACVDAPDLVSSYSRDVIEKNRKDFRELNFRTEAKAQKAQQAAKEQTSTLGQYYSVRSRKALAEAAAKKQVVLHAGTLKRDRQKRIIADAVLEHGRSLSAHLVMNGLAYVVFDRDFPPEYQEVL